MAPATGYLETMVLSYLTAGDARDGIIAAHQSVTRTWWESHRHQYRRVASAIVVPTARDSMRRGSVVASRQQVRMSTQ